MNDIALAVTQSSPTVLTTAGIRRGGRWQQVFIPVKNVPGELRRIDKRALTIDLSYQRRLDRPRVAAMAANWSWVSCGALIVALRNDDKLRYYVLDGQHRLEAAMLIDDISDLPCLLFPLDEIRDEAVGFLATNVSRKLPSLADQFKALIIAGNQDAILADRMARACGRHIAAGTGPYTISCASELLRMIQQDHKAVEACWPALGRLCSGYPMPARIIRGVIGLQRRMSGKNTFTNPFWADRLVKIGYDATFESIKQLGLVERGYSERVCAEGVLRALNRGLRDKLNINWNRQLR